MLNVGADWGEICLYVNISFLLIRELDLFIVQVNEIISVIPQKFDQYMKMMKAHDRTWKENQALGIWRNMKGYNLV